jgi:predicted homoserine dehydrogenase-like protein
LRPETCAVEVVAVAKRQLPAGTKLDGIGGYHTYGTAEETSRAHRLGLLPIGLSEGSTLRRPIETDQTIRLADVMMPERRLLDVLWSEQARSAAS